MNSTVISPANTTNNTAANGGIHGAMSSGRKKAIAFAVTVATAAAAAYWPNMRPSGALSMKREDADMPHASTRRHGSATTIEST